MFCPHVVVFRILFGILFVSSSCNSEWIYDDVNDIWAYEHPTDKILDMLFAPTQHKDPTCHLCGKLNMPNCEWHFNGKLCFSPVTLYYSGKDCAEVRVSCVGGDLKAHGEVIRTRRIGTFRLTPMETPPRIWHLSEPEPTYQLPVILKCSRNATWTGIIWKKHLKYEQMRVDQVYCI